MITVSLVSHDHNQLIPKLIKSLIQIKSISKIVITFNLSREGFELDFEDKGKIILIDNKKPKGFAANHNSAFEHCETQFFCILNPDVEFFTDPFPSLLKNIDNVNVIVSPSVINSDGNFEDHARKFPTLVGVILKILRINDGRIKYNSLSEAFSPDWVAGLFMLVSAKFFRDISGFNEKYFLYYEDVDLCMRACRNGKEIRVCPDVTILHLARRDSHKKLRYFLLHIKSMLRFFLSYPAQLIKF